MKVFFVTLFFVFAFSALANLPERERTDELGYTQLLIVAERGDTDRVIRYVKEGSNIEAKNMWGKTALMLALHGGHIRTAVALLEKGANLRAVDRYGNTPLSLIVDKLFNGEIKKEDLQAIRGVLFRTDRIEDLIQHVDLFLRNRKIETPTSCESSFS